MNKESDGLHIIFIIILSAILFLSYCSLPSLQHVRMRHKISKKAQTRFHLPENKEDMTVSEDTHVKDAVIVEKVEEEPESITETRSEAQKEEPVSVAAVSQEKVNKALKIDVISMNTAEYKDHKKGIVQFTHQNHVEKYLLSCGSCHHDEAGKPLTLTVNDRPRRCIECHKETRKPKGEKLDKKEKIKKYHFEALHANCIGCHKIYNKEKGDPKGKKPAPTSCKLCHKKK